MKNRAVTVLLGIGCVVMIILYLFKGEVSRNRDFNKEQKELGDSIRKMNVQITELSNQRDLLKLQRDSLSIVVLNNDTIIKELRESRHRLKNRSYENHTDIDSSSINELSNIITRYIAD